MKHHKLSEPSFHLQKGGHDKTECVALGAERMHGVRADWHVSLPFYDSGTCALSRSLHEG